MQKTDIRASIVDVLADRRYEDVHRRCLVDLLHNTPLADLFSTIAQNIYAQAELFRMLMEHGEDYPDLWEVVNAAIDASVEVTKEAA